VEALEDEDLDEEEAPPPPSPPSSLSLPLSCSTPTPYLSPYRTPYRTPQMYTLAGAREPLPPHRRPQLARAATHMQARRPPARRYPPLPRLRHRGPF